MNTQNIKQIVQLHTIGLNEEQIVKVLEMKDNNRPAEKVKPVNPENPAIKGLNNNKVYSANKSWCREELRILKKCSSMREAQSYLPHRTDKAIQAKSRAIKNTLSAYTGKAKEDKRDYSGNKFRMKWIHNKKIELKKTHSHLSRDELFKIASQEYRKEIMGEV